MIFNLKVQTVRYMEKLGCTLGLVPCERSLNVPLNGSRARRNVMRVKLQKATKE